MNWLMMIDALQHFWAKHDCAILHPYDVEKGAGTMNPLTFLRSLGPEPFRVAYLEPSRRPTDGRYGENPNRLYKHHQFQVLIKPAPETIQDLYLDSLGALGIDLCGHDVRFVEDNWENPTLGAAGLGWEVWLDGMEVTQFTYFQQVGSLEMEIIPAEITYGLERLASYIQRKTSVFELEISPTLRYKDVFLQEEYEQSTYALDVSNVDWLVQLFEMYEREADRILNERQLAFPAYDCILKCSHTLNVLESRGSLGVAERVEYIGRVRTLARRVARCYIAERKRMGYPLLPASDVEVGKKDS
ncbi:glycine--tRNA ligase subunit alpha [Pasteuria penetrans]|uniref:glycine--tRNA ligase subunit alpha n=1 Tax=Pasteuria penetrans TaxID=86005 RepID=UPI000FB8AB58|nr:glycine--tRNA ligase subunit alpha [Pasteuria penetrans]